MTEQLLFTPVPLDQLKTEISEIVRTELTNHFLSTTQETKTEIFDRKQASVFLGVSLPTLLDWTKSGKIAGYRIGSRVRYKRAELENSLKKIHTFKQGGNQR